MAAPVDLSAELAAIRHELFRLNAVREIQNLMGAYTVNHLPKNMHDHIELFAMYMPDVSAEVGDREVYVGPDALRTLFGKQFAMGLKGNLLIHYLATPMIEVAGDGKTAKGVWRSPGIEAVRPPDGGKPVPIWSFGAYANDFIHVDGCWKIWHFHWFRVVKSNFHEGWVDDLSMAFGGKMANSPALQATTYHNPYTPDSTQESVPPCPKPYDTWTGEPWAVREQLLGKRTPPA